ncbi:MAG: glutamate--cysteine ligase [Ancalomicrobiaceae bacterium]|nr:glutamate--cysteine ligase [Ancalomicrobiaceae bacterium]
MARDTVDAVPIESREQLVHWLGAGAKPAADWRIGTEHEKFGFYRDDKSPVGYFGAAGIEAIVLGLKTRLGWEPILDRDHIIGLVDPTGGGAISLEPGGQFELSGAPLSNLHQTSAEFETHLADTAAVADPLGIGFLGAGTSPKWRLADTPVMPKSRYDIMTAYMPKVGTRGRDMMFRTSTVQVNLDFSSEDDMARKLRVSLALQPVVTALFAASPFLDGKPTGLLSTRAEIWRDTDVDRTGNLPFAFASGFGYEAYVDWALDVPMYFVKRGDTYHNVAGVPFRAFIDGKLKDRLPGITPEIGDWANHLGSLFPDVRLKRYLEQRGADAGSLGHMLALPALWVGLLYDAASLDAAEALVAGWDAATRDRLRAEVPRLALKTPMATGSVQDVASEAVAIAKAGLRRRAIFDNGRDESIYLEPIEEIAASGVTVAERMLADFNGAWGGDIDRIFAAYALT